MAKLIEITGKALSGEWGADDETGNGIPVLRTTNFTNEGVVDYSNVVTRKIVKKGIEEKYLRNGDIIIEKSGGSDKQPVGRVIYFEGAENTYLFNNFTGLLRVKNQGKWHPRYVFYSLFSNYRGGGTRTFQNKTTGLHNLKTDDYVSSFNVTEVDIATQKAICKQLDLVNAIIRMRQQQFQKLDELVKVRFVELFGDPVRNSMGLKTMPLGKACCLKAGITTSADMIHEQSNEFSIPCYGGNGIRGYVELATQCGCYPIIGRQGALCGNVQLATGKFHATEHAVLVTPLIETNVIWLFYLLKMMDLYRFHTGAAQPGLAVKTLNTVDIPIADVAAQHQFAAFVTQTDKSKVAVQKALDEAHLLFDSLMQKYFG